MSEEIRHRRVRAQLLHRPDGFGVVEVVRRLLAVQAQDIAAFPLALRARIAGLTAADVTAARNTGEIVRCWGPRGTLHLIAAEDLSWLFPLVRPAATGSLRRLRALGVEVDPGEAVRSVAAALAGQGPLGKAALGERLAQGGLPAEGQAILHLAMLAAREGLVVLGPDRAGKPTYVHAPDWLGRPLPVTVPDRDAALRRLARRYRLAHEPAEPADLAAWSGLPLGEARRAWPGSEPPPSARTTPEHPGFERADSEHADFLPAKVEHADFVPADAERDGFVPAEVERPDAGPGPVVRLVPGFDEYLLGRRTRELSVPGPYRTLIHPGGGIIRPTLLVDGQAAGTWRTRRSARRVGIIVEPFQPLSGAVLSEVRAEAADIGRFLGLPAEPTVIS